jgi:hypothetical protein
VTCVACNLAPSGCFLLFQAVEFLLAAELIRFLSHSYLEFYYG